MLMFGGDGVGDTEPNNGLTAVGAQTIRSVREVLGWLVQAALLKTSLAGWPIGYPACGCPFRWYKLRIRGGLHKSNITMMLRSY